MRFVLNAALLGVNYLILVGSVSPGNCGMALVFGALAAWAGGLGRERLLAWTPKRVAALPGFAAAIAAAMARGTVQMLRVLLSRRGWRNVGFVEVPMGERTARGAAVSGLIATATPGSTLVEIEEGEERMLFNVIDASRPEEIRAEQQRFYGRFQREVVP